MKNKLRNLLLGTMALCTISCQNQPTYDTIISQGMLYDGTGGNPVVTDIAILHDTIAAIGDLSKATAREVVNAKGKAVAPGFINMMGHSEETLFADGRAQSDIRQGVTLEVFCESSFGPLNNQMKKQVQEGQGDIKYPVHWNTLGEYMQQLEKKGISPNIASYVGAGTIRINVLGEGKVTPTPDQLKSMQSLVDQAMQEGALGVTCALIYPPDNFASTEELIALCKVAARYGGSYSSHIRSEGNRFIPAVEEFIRICKESGVIGELHHLKAAGKNNWNKMDSAIALLEKARASGLPIAADMYTYVAGATGLTSCFPPSLQDGGFGKLRERLQDPAIRKNMKAAMNSNPSDWENLYSGAGGAEHVLLLSFKQDSLKKYTGKTLAEVAAIRKQAVEECAMDLIIQDSTRVGVAYFLMNEENVRKQAGLHWVSFGSDEGSYTNEGVFLKSSAHPRAYGNFARFLGKYVRDEKVCSLSEAIYKLSCLPAEHLKLQRRGRLQTGYFADIVVFDPATIQDHATFEKPHQYATGVSDVWVNGKAVLAKGNPTGATPGRFVKGPGYKK
ncbi:MAG: D-aminoacylase [Chitinophagia bacterium]|jgi:N-acyl-D-amino-acid deacylase